MDGAQQSGPPHRSKLDTDDDEFEDCEPSGSGEAYAMKEKQVQTAQNDKKELPLSAETRQMTVNDYVLKAVQGPHGAIGAVVGTMKAGEMENVLNVGQGANLKDSHAVGLVAFNTEFKQGVKNVTNATSQQQLTPEQEECRQKLQDGGSKGFYKLTGDRYALIISNTFDKRSSAKKYGEKYQNSNRQGGENDVKRMDSLLQILGFKVTQERNVDSKDLESVMQKFKRDVVENEASVAFVVVMSHGEDDCVQMDDLELLDAYEKFVYAFASDDAVHAIPKIFLFNMCRPWSSTPKFQTDSARHAEQFTYNVKNTIIIFSTIRHEPSLRDQYTGSLYISQFVKTVEKQYKQKSLNDMLFDVFVQVQNEYGQTPCYENMGFQNLKFFNTNKPSPTEERVSIGDTEWKDLLSERGNLPNSIAVNQYVVGRGKTKASEPSVTNVSANAIHAENFQSNQYVLQVNEPEKPVKGVWNAPAPIETFVGRYDVLDTVKDKLKSCASEQHYMRRIVALVAMGGMGKTEAARKFSHKYKTQYENVAWINAETEDSLKASFEELCEHFELPHSSKATGEVLAQRVYAHLGQTFEQPTLFIFDNASRLKTEGEVCGIYDYLPRRETKNLPLILLTSQTTEWKRHKCEVIDVTWLSREESLELLLSNFQVTPDALHEDKELESLMNGLVERLIGYPLALGLAAANISFIPGQDSMTVLKERLAEYTGWVDDLEKILDQRVDTQLDTEYPKTLEIVWSITMKNLGRRAHGREAKYLLSIIADFPNGHNLRVAELFEMYSGTCEAFGVVFPTQHDVSFDAALSELQTVGLLRRRKMWRPSDEKIIIHRLMHILARREDQDDLVRQKILLSIFRSVSYISDDRLWSLVWSHELPSHEELRIPNWALKDERASLFFLTTAILLYEKLGNSDDYRYIKRLVKTLDQFPEQYREVVQVCKLVCSGCLHSCRKKSFYDAAAADNDDQDREEGLLFSFLIPCCFRAQRATTEVKEPRGERKYELTVAWNIIRDAIRAKSSLTTNAADIRVTLEHLLLYATHQCLQHVELIIRTSEDFQSCYCWVAIVDCLKQWLMEFDYLSHAQIRSTTLDIQLERVIDDCIEISDSRPFIAARAKLISPVALLRVANAQVAVDGNSEIKSTVAYRLFDVTLPAAWDACDSEVLIRDYQLLDHLACVLNTDATFFSRKLHIVQSNGLLILRDLVWRSGSSQYVIEHATLLAAVKSEFLEKFIDYDFWTRRSATVVTLGKNVGRYPNFPPVLPCGVDFADGRSACMLKTYRFLVACFALALELRTPESPASHELSKFITHDMCHLVIWKLGRTQVRAGEPSVDMGRDSWAFTSSSLGEDRPILNAVRLCLESEAAAIDDHGGFRDALITLLTKLEVFSKQIIVVALELETNSAEINDTSQILAGASEGSMLDPVSRLAQNSDNETDSDCGDIVGGSIEDEAREFMETFYRIREESRPFREWFEGKFKQKPASCVGTNSEDVVQEPGPSVVRNLDHETGSYCSDISSGSMEDDMRDLRSTFKKNYEDAKGEPATKFERNLDDDVREVAKVLTPLPSNAENQQILDNFQLQLRLLEEFADYQRPEDKESDMFKTKVSAFVSKVKVEYAVKLAQLAHTTVDCTLFYSLALALQDQVKAKFQILGDLSILDGDPLNEQLTMLDSFMEDMVVSQSQILEKKQEDAARAAILQAEEFHGENVGKVRVLHLDLGAAVSLRGLNVNDDHITVQINAELRIYSRETLQCLKVVPSVEGSCSIWDSWEEKCIDVHLGDTVRLTLRDAKGDQVESEYAFDKNKNMTVNKLNCLEYELVISGYRIPRDSRIHYILLFDKKSWKPLWEIIVDSSIESISSDGERIITLHSTQMVRVWNKQHGTLVSTFRPPRPGAYTNCVDGRIVVDGNTKIWDVHSGKEIGELNVGETNYIKGIELNEWFVATVDSYEMVSLWSLASILNRTEGANVVPLFSRKLSRHETRTCPMVRLGPSVLVVLNAKKRGGNAALEIFEFDSEPFKSEITAQALKAENNVASSGPEDEAVHAALKKMRVPKLRVNTLLTERSDWVHWVDLHPTEPWMLVALNNGNVQIWNHENQQLIKSFEVWAVMTRSAKFVPRKNWVLLGSVKAQVRVYNYSTLEVVHTFEAHPDSNHKLLCIAVHPTQPYILTNAEEKVIKLWNWENAWCCERIFQGHTSVVPHIVFNPKDTDTFASASRDCTVKVWQLGSATPSFTLVGHNWGVTCVDFYRAEDKPYLISCGFISVKIWDYQEKTCLRTLQFKNGISHVAFHPQLPIFLMCSEDGTVRLVHLKSYFPVSNVHHNLDSVWSIACLPGSNSLAIGYSKGSVVANIEEDFSVSDSDTELPEFDSRCNPV